MQLRTHFDVQLRSPPNPTERDNAMFGNDISDQTATTSRNDMSLLGDQGGQHRPSRWACQGPE